MEVTDKTDRDLIAETLEHDRKATRGPWWADVRQPRCWVESAAGEICIVNDFTPPVPNCNEDLIAAYRTAAPELARRLAALLDALDSEWASANYLCAKGDARDVIDGVRAAYARNLEET